MQFWNCLLHSIMFAISLSTDAFAASTAYGAGGIRIPWRSATVISVVCSAMLAGSLAIGSSLQGLLPSGSVRFICFILLCGIGVMRLFDSVLKEYIRRHQKLDMQFATNHLHFMLIVYADNENADVDHSKELSPREAATLAVALSLDGLAVGIGAALTGIGVMIPTLVSLLLTAAAIPLGCMLGKHMKHLLPFDLSIVSAVLLIVIAVVRLIG